LIGIITNGNLTRALRGFQISRGRIAVLMDKLNRVRLEPRRARQLAGANARNRLLTRTSVAQYKIFPRIHISGGKIVIVLSQPYTIRSYKYSRMVRQFHAGARN